jgi:hypothetical protein
LGKESFFMPLASILAKRKKGSATDVRLAHWICKAISKRLRANQHYIWMTTEKRSGKDHLGGN